MEYKSLDRITNRYPADELSMKKSALTEKTQTSFRLLGKYSENFADYPITDYTNITPVTGTSFEFVVELNPGRYYTSQPFYDTLKTAYEEMNPFFNMKTVPLVKLDYNFLQNYKNKNKFKITEAYCEVEVVESIDTEERICKHIDWLVSKDANDIELRPVTDLGRWRIFHNPKGDYALGAKDEYDAMTNGNPDPEGYGANITLEQYDLTLPKEAVVSINQPSQTQLNPVEELVRIMANVPTPPGHSLYKPFGGTLGLVLGGIAGVAISVLTGGIAALGVGALLTGGAIAGAAVAGSYIGKTLGDVLGKNYTADGKYWAIIIQRENDRSLGESINKVFNREKNSDEAEWKELMIATGKQIKCVYTASDVNQALKIILSMAVGEGDSNGTVRKSDYGYAVNVGNGTRWFRTNAVDKFNIKITY
jgi:hypothetical protein